MRYHALATDYDETIAVHGRLSPGVISALERLRVSGRKAILVTGRTVDDLRTACPRLDLFHCVVAENGAVLYWPDTRETNLLCEPMPPEFLEALRERGIPHSVGRVVVGSHVPHECAILEVIRELDRELHIVFNGHAVMVLPPGVNKGTGLETALGRMGLSTHEVVGVGNASNDHSFLARSECAVAVADAVPAVKARAAFVTTGGAGDGVVELIEELLRDDLGERRALLAHDSVLLGVGEGGDGVSIPAYGDNLLVAGSSGAGKSTFAAGFIERLVDKRYQVCIVDPEGDYGTIDELVTIGSRLRAPHVSEVLDLLGEPATNLVVNLLGISLPDRPAFVAELLPRLQAMRARTGRPHWVVVDEAHHVWPASWGLVPATVPQKLGEAMLVTVDPAELAPALLPLVDVAVAVGPRADATLRAVAAGLGLDPPPVSSAPIGHGEILAWFLRGRDPPRRLQTVRARSARLRHLRKYAEGNLGPHGFVFRGPAGKLRLRAQNLVAFCELADGVDDETWLFHLRGGHYSEWLRSTVKDADLAREVSAIERSRDLSARESRRAVREAVEQRYTAPA